MNPAAEFSRPVLVARLGAGPFRQAISAGEAERAALVRRFGLVALDRLDAQVELIRRGADMILLRASFEAEFVQECVVTLDPVPGAVSEEFALLYGPPELEETAMGVAGDEVAFEPFTGDAVDIGEAVAQEFSLALPPFPRSAAADLATATPPAEDAGPLSALARWRQPPGDETP